MSKNIHQILNDVIEKHGKCENPADYLAIQEAKYIQTVIDTGNYYYGGIAGCAPEKFQTVKKLTIAYFKMICEERKYPTSDKKQQERRDTGYNTLKEVLAETIAAFNSIDTSDEKKRVDTALNAYAKFINTFAAYRRTYLPKEVN